jgi:hypothetical protein
LAAKAEDLARQRYHLADLMTGGRANARLFQGQGLAHALFNAVPWIAPYIERRPHEAFRGKTFSEITEDLVGTIARQTPGDGGPEAA